MADAKAGATTPKKTAGAADKKPRAKKEYKDEADRFKQLGNKRLRAALKQLRLIGNLSGSGYEYTEEQVSKIRTSLQEALNAAMARFDKKKKPEEQVEL